MNHPKGDAWRRNGGRVGPALPGPSPCSRAEEPGLARRDRDRDSVRGGRWRPVAVAAWATLLLVAVLLAGCRQAPGPDEVLRQYLDAWQRQDYAGMYALLDTASREAVAEQDFTDRYRRIEEGIERTGLTAQVRVPEDFRPQGDEVSLSFEARWETALAGTFTQQYTARLVREEEGWRVRWTPSLIFPGLEEGDKVRAQTLPARRGSLLDRQGRPLAVDEPARAIGLVPGKMTPDSARRLAEVLGITPEAVERQLQQPWVRDDLFVPVVTWPAARAEDAGEALRAIPGVLVSSSRETARWYPNGALAAHTLGYTGPITAEELTAERRQAGYGETDRIGKQGLERAMEEQLRGRHGGRIWIERADGSEGPEIARRDPQPGRDLRLTLDLDVQRALEQVLDETVGDGRQGSGSGRLDGQAAAVVLDPATGDVLALASRPAFDPNRLADGITAEEWQQLSDDSRAPLYHKALSPLPPGSTFKPFTAAVALETGVITPDTDFGPSPEAWQKDASWGDYYVRRVPHPPGRVNLIRALAWSDNVYFARVGLQLGTERFTQGLARFGLGAEFPFDLPVRAGQVAGEGGIRSEIQLADSAYGQGEVQLSPLQLATMYTAFVRDGDVVRPRLVLGTAGEEPAREGAGRGAPAGEERAGQGEDAGEAAGKDQGVGGGAPPAGGDQGASGPASGAQAGGPDLLARGAVSPATARVIRDALRQVVTDPAGTARALAAVRGWTVAGKTGTAQVASGETGARWRWFAGWAAPAGGERARYVIAVAVHQLGAADEGTPNPAVTVAGRFFSRIRP